MRILTRYLVREMLGPFVFGVLAFASIIIGFNLIGYAQNPQLSGLLVLRLTLLAIPENLNLAFPMGVLLGTLFALGRLSGHSEITAMRAGGFSSFRLMVPFVLFGFLASLASLAVSEIVVPITHRTSTRVIAEALNGENAMVLRQQVLPAEYDKDGKLKRLITVGQFDLKDLYLRDVYIWEFDQGRESIFVHADTMAWDGNLWQFISGRILFHNQDGSITRLNVRDGRTKYQPLLPKPKDISLAASQPLDMTWKEYRAFIVKRELAGENVLRLWVELYTRLALPFACMVLALAGTPLGVQPQRSGTAFSFGLALLILIIYYFLLSFGQVLGRSGILPPVLAAWIANIIVCGMGVYLFAKRMQ